MSSFIRLWKCYNNGIHFIVFHFVVHELTGEHMNLYFDVLHTIWMIHLFVSKL